MVLHNVAAYYFKKPEILSWFLLNWDILQEKRDEMLSTARSLGYDITM